MSHLENRGNLERNGVKARTKSVAIWKGYALGAVILWEEVVEFSSITHRCQTRPGEGLYSRGTRTAQSDCGST